MLDDPEVSSFAEAIEWREQIRAVDNEYRRVLIGLPGAQERPWWRAGVPGSAGKELAADVARLFGLTLKVND